MFSGIMDIDDSSSETCQRCVKHFDQKETRYKEEIKNLQNQLQHANKTIEAYKLEIERLRGGQPDLDFDPLSTKDESPEENHELIIGNEAPPCQTVHIKTEPEEVIFHIEELGDDPLTYSDTGEYSNASPQTNISTSTSTAPSSCMVCQRTFETVAQLNRHLHVSSIKWYFFNPNGGNSTSTDGHLLFCHVPDCGIAMQTQAQLTEHMWMHITLPYRCLNCDKQFSQYDRGACNHEKRCTIVNRKWNPNKAGSKQVEYKWMQGFRRNHNLLYSITEKQFYTKNKELKNRWLFYCSVRTCKARLVMCDDNVCIKLPNFVEHNHPSKEEMYNQLLIRNKLIEEVQNVRDSNGSLNDLESLNSIYAKNVTTSGYVCFVSNFASILY